MFLDNVLSGSDCGPPSNGQLFGHQTLQGLQSGQLELTNVSMATGTAYPPPRSTVHLNHQSSMCKTENLPSGQSRACSMSQNTGIVVYPRASEVPSCSKTNPTSTVIQIGKNKVRVIQPPDQSVLSSSQTHGRVLTGSQLTTATNPSSVNIVPAKQMQQLILQQIKGKENTVTNFGPGQPPVFQPKPFYSSQPTVPASTPVTIITSSQGHASIVGQGHGSKSKKDRGKKRLTLSQRNSPEIPSVAQEVTVKTEPPESGHGYFRSRIKNANKYRKWHDVFIL